MSRKMPLLVGSALLSAAIAAPVLSVPAVTTLAPATAAKLKLHTSAAPKLSSALAGVKGEVEVVVQLADAPLAIANGEDAKHTGARFNRSQQIAFTRDIKTHQDGLLRKILALGGKEVARVRIAYNAVIVRIDAAKLATIAQMSEVLTVRPVGQYKLSLSTTVPYIGATTLHGAGVDGSGIRVAILDSGIDYTHKNLGGPGTVAAYKAAAGAAAGDPKATTTDGLFPTAKVVGGFDFVGDAWDGTPTSPARTEDPDPIDVQGHGTHVADILGGRSADGTHVGVAPGASLYAVKVCSSVSTSCNGVALLLGLDYALNPSGDGSMDDAVDVINMSLGTAYGVIQDDLSFAAANAVHAGVVVVSASGNDGDKPYVTGSPGSTPEVISVAETQVPTAEAVPLVVTAPASIAGKYANTATITWAPVGSGATGKVVYVGDGCTVTTPGDTYLANPAGKIALVDRGTCNVSEKVKGLSDAGALGVIVGLVAPGDAVTFSNGGQCPDSPNDTCKPSLVVTQSTADTLKSALTANSAVSAAISESNAISLVGSMTSTSSRGPDDSFNRIKPDIGAPGASVSAVVGTGNGEAAFGGTSGAAPMVAGSAALLLQAYPNRSPAEIKSILMNTADTQVYTNPALYPGQLAPITRIGGGEVRVDLAAQSQTAAWDDGRKTGSLSFGYHAVDNSDFECRPVRVRNYSRSPRLYKVKSSFRYADDASSHAVSFILPPFVFVGPRSSATFPACISIEARKLPVWTLDGGPDGGTGSLLQSVEYDGYVSISDSTDDIHLAWQVLPHRSATVNVDRSSVQIPLQKVGTTVGLTNSSASLDGRVELFALTGTSRKVRKAQLPGPGDAFEIIDLAAVGARLVDLGDEGLGLQFGISTFGARAHPAYPGGFEVDIDIDGDGTADWALVTAELGGTFAADGRTAVYLQKLVPPGTTPPGAVAVAFADADLDSGNMILTVSLADLGITPTTRITFSVGAFDDYFTGNFTDVISNMVFTPGVPKFFATGLPDNGVPARHTSPLTIERVDGGDVASPSQTGVLLLYRDAQPNREAQTILVTDSRRNGPALPHR